MRAWVRNPAPGQALRIVLWRPFAGLFVCAQLRGACGVLCGRGGQVPAGAAAAEVRGRGLARPQVRPRLLQIRSMNFSHLSSRQARPACTRRRCSPRALLASSLYNGRANRAAHSLLQLSHTLLVTKPWCLGQGRPPAANPPPVAALSPPDLRPSRQRLSQRTAQRCVIRRVCEGAILGALAAAVRPLSRGR